MRVNIKVIKGVAATNGAKVKGRKMAKYFKITGLDNGIEIEPYGVETNGSCPTLNVGLYGDRVRYYEPITKEDYQKLTNRY